MSAGERDGGEVREPDFAAAREAAYGVFAGLVSGRLTPETVEQARWHDGLAPHLDESHAAAAELVAGLTHGALPYAGAWLDDPPLLGGAAAEARQTRWRAWGLREAGFEREPEHLATHLAALSFLCGAEADAQLDGAEAEARRMRREQGVLLDELLLPWLPAWAVAVEPEGLCAALASALSTLVASHRASLEPTSDPTPRESRESRDPCESMDLAAASTSLHDLVVWLLCPARCGFLLTRQHLATLGRTLDLPRGFGDRATELTNLLRNAARFDALPALRAGLDGLLHGAERAHAVSALAPWSTPWADLLARTRASLRSLRIPDEGPEPGPERDSEPGPEPST